MTERLDLDISFAGRIDVIDKRVKRLETLEFASVAVGGGIVTVNWIFYEGGEVLTAGLSGFLRVGFAGEIQDVEMMADQVGDFECDIWIEDYAGSPPTVADSVCGAAFPALAADQKMQDTALVGWTKEFDPGWWGFNVRGVPAAVTQVTIGVNVEKLPTA